MRTIVESGTVAEKQGLELCYDPVRNHAGDVLGFRCFVLKENPKGCWKTLHTTEQFLSIQEAYSTAADFVEQMEEPADETD